MKARKKPVEVEVEQLNSRGLMEAVKAEVKE